LAHWVELEAVKDDYSALYFYLDKWMNKCSGVNDGFGQEWGFCLRFQTKLFNSNISRYPAYIQPYVLYSTSNTCYLPLDDPFIQDRIEAMFSAISGHIGTDSKFRYLMMPESAIPGATLTDRETRVAAQGYLAQRMHEILTHHPSSVYFNDGNATSPLLLPHAQNGAGTGGPDVYIGVYENNCFLGQAYDYRRSVAGLVPNMQEVQQNNFLWDCAAGSWAHSRTPAQQVQLLFDFVKANNLANYMSWQTHINWIDPAYEPAVEALWADIFTNQHPGDPAGGLMSELPSALQA